jgi:hypothetical protein
MRRRSVVAVLLCALVIGASAVMLLNASPRSPQLPLQAGDLSALWKTGGVLQDRNGDGVVDFVDARLVLGDPPGEDDVAAAGDIAARLGFETSAMTLPVTRGDTGTPIVVGQAGLARAGIGAADVGASGLEAGEGLVAVVRLKPDPTRTVGADAVLVAGGDGTGTRAAAAMLAGRLPYIWDPKGPTLDTVAEGVKAFLTNQKVQVSSADVPAVYVRAGDDALERLVVRANVASAADLASARTALRKIAQGRAAAAAAPLKAAAAAPELSTPGAKVMRVRLVTPGTAPVDVDVPRAEAPEPAPLARRSGGPKANLDLSSIFQNDGLLGDSDNNLIPDRVEAVLSPAGAGTERAIDLAARLGLESTGVSIPLVVPPGAIAKPDDEPTLVLIGVSHPIVDELAKSKKLVRPALEPGQGLLQVVRKAFGEKGAVVITGGDARGVDRALEQAAERLPHIWQRGKDRTTIDDVEEDVRTLLSGRSPAGQGAMALYKIDQLSRELAGKDIEQARVRVFVEKAPAGFADFARREVSGKFKLPQVDVTVEDLDVQRAKPVAVGGQPISEEFDVPSEVDDFWQVFRARVVPSIKKRQPVVVEARLSEPPEIRRRIADQARAELVKAGASDPGTSVTVLSAYKQGYSWLYDVVRPELAGKPVDSLTIRFAEIGPPPEWKQQAMFTPTRWLLEIYPIDEVLARELPIDLKRIHFEKMPIGSPAYEAIATGAGGKEILRQTFDPKYVVRPYFDRFPDYEKVRVTTGWITASVGGRSVADQRIETDPERFWDHFQSKTLPAIYDYVMAQFEGKPDPADPPLFGELVVDLTLSEPEYQIGVDQEHVASMEAMHEEIYFATLHFFDVLGRYARGRPLDYPGRVIPLMHPREDGKPGHAKITFTGFDSPTPAVWVEYRERGGRDRVVKREIPKIAIDRPTALATTVRAGRNGLERLDVRVKVDTDKDERPALVRRAREDQVDASILSAEQVVAVVGDLNRLRAAGLYADSLAYHDLGAVRITAGWTFDPDPAAERVATLEGGTPAPFPDIHTYLTTGTYRYTGGPIVQWDTPIPPPEAYELLAKMSTFPEATVYKVGETYLGKEVWAMDLMPPVQASHWSQAKMTTLKPTVVYSARQHANEVSSTSHVLKLAEMLLTDPAYKEKLKKVNVVIHPITNPDGAQLAYDLQKITPDHMLHAGYLGSLGVDMTSPQWDPDPIYPEAGIRPKLWRTWLPDVFLNPHGYPSHEWVQLFSEYAGWVRNRVTESRDWWTMRGWFMPGFTYLDDPRYPRYKEAALRMRELITRNINAAPEVRAMNQRAYDRYRRYGFQFDEENFKLDFTDDVLIYSALKGMRASAQSQDFVARQPNVTIWFGTTEAPDETARGDWMKLVATAGLQWDKALLDYLVEGHHTIERKGDAFWGGVSLTETRPRPPKEQEPENKGSND